VLLAGIVINYSLGGFKSIEPSLVSNDKTTIYGFLYEGGHSSDSLNNQIALLRDILNGSNTGGTLTIVNYIQPRLEKRGVIRQFIGIEWKDNSKHTIISLDTLTIPGYNGLQFRIPIRPLVMPSPERLKKLANAAATEMEANLMDFSIEQYKDQVLINNFPLK
jgi:hypothetical protein